MRGGDGGSLEDELCPDQIAGWTVQDAFAAVCPHFGNNRIKGLISGAGGDILLGKDAQK
jgi:hypothetical protein